MTAPESRRDARTAVHWIALIRLADGTEVPCTVRDVSAHGMKISAPATQALPEGFTLKVIGRDLVFRVRQAWRRGHDVGLTIERIAKLPKPPEPAATAPAPAPVPAKVPERPVHVRIGSRERHQGG